MKGEKMNEKGEGDINQIIAMGFTAWEWGFIVRALKLKKEHFSMAEEPEIAERLIKEIGWRAKAQIKRNATFEKIRLRTRLRRIKEEKNEL